MFGAQSWLIGLQSILMAIQFPFSISLSIYISIYTLNLTQWEINQISYNKMRLNLFFYSVAHGKLSKTTLGFISRLINLNYTFYLNYAF